jgi:hypothetical protein
VTAEDLMAQLVEEVRGLRLAMERQHAPPANAIPEVVDLAEAMRILRCSRAQVFRLRRSGKIQGANRAGNEPLFIAESLRAFLVGEPRAPRRPSEPRPAQPPARQPSPLRRSPIRDLLGKG